MSNLPFALPDIGEAEIAAVVEVLRSGWLTTGPTTKAFETEFAEFVHAENAVAVNSATSGLHLSYEALGVGPGDQVVMPTWTFTATAEAVRYLGADPVFVDIDPATYLMDLTAADAAVTDRTVIVAPVHFAGLPVPDKGLSALADKNDLAVFEDDAHSFPALNDGRLIGGHGHAATVFSFYATKTITTGEGGMVTTADPVLAARMRTMRLHGISRDIFNRYTDVSQRSWYYEVIAPGYKYNMTDVAAALGRVQLTRAYEMYDRRCAIAARYDAGLAGLPLNLPAHAPEGSTHAWHLYVVNVADGAPRTRDEVVDALTASGIGTSLHFIPLHLQPYWRDTYHLAPEMFPVASELYERTFSLPIYTRMTDADVDRVIEALWTVLGR
jgi:dTDP-4-amino-4,6-dideoxygalactose transaminase